MLVSDKTKINLIKHLQQNQTNTKSKKKIPKKGGQFEKHKLCYNKIKNRTI